MEIRNYTQGDEHAIIELFELVFKQKYSLEQWNWRFVNNPSGKHLIKLMWENNQLVGHYAVSPLEVMVNGRTVKTAHSLTTMTHPDFGGRGIFKLLSKSLYDELENELGFKAIWGFPNNNSHYGFINGLEWKDLCVIHTLGAKAESFEKSTLEASLLNPIAEFTDEHADFVMQFLKKNKVYVNRNKTYLNWRYVAKPAVKYNKYFGTIDGKKYLIVTKLYPSANNDVWDLNIVDLFVDDYGIVSGLVHLVLKDYGLKFNRVTLWKNIFDSDHIHLEKIGFIPTLPQTYLSSRTHSSMDDEFNDIRNWHFAMGDSDVF
jgi:Acetyltransferase (GNAT) domain